MENFIEQQIAPHLPVLHQYKILDTLPEEDFDNITRLASHICKTPIALISLVDEKRQWFKSAQGVDIRETPIEYSFCAHAIKVPSSRFVVENAPEDTRFTDNPLVTGDPHIVFYTGIPLKNEQGIAYGTLCVIDKQERKLNSDQIEALEVLAKQTVNLLELRKKELEKDKEIKDLEDRNKALGQFAYVAAHDIRSPLSSIITITNVLEKNLEEVTDDKNLELVNLIRSCSTQLTDFIEGLLTYNRCQNFLKEQVKPIDILKLVEQVEMLFAGNSKVSFEKKSNTKVVYSVPIAIEQILLNLVSNAIKYNDKKECRIKIACKEQDRTYRFCISDNGPGFPEKNRDKMFELFVVGSQQSNDGTKGNGIGLATVARVVKMLGGEINIDAIPGKGTNFYFTIEKG
ncbi:MAG: GAF domain-containing sensor histidine kinase [Luteibaculum sp.]